MQGLRDHVERYAFLLHAADSLPGGVGEVKVDDDEFGLVGGLHAVAGRDALAAPSAGCAVLRVKVGEVDPGRAAALSLRAN
jgi:hypothetical protein